MSIWTDYNLICPRWRGTHNPSIIYVPKGPSPKKDDRWEVEKILGHRGTGDNMAWKVQWKAGDVTWEKKGQFIYGCQSDWLAYKKKGGIPIQISRVSTPPEAFPWDQTWPT